MTLFSPSNSELGQLKNSWIESYTGQKAYFVNNNTVAYACGSTIKFYNLESKQSNSIDAFDGAEFNSVCLFTANSAIQKFAFSETQLSPKVFVYDFENQKPVEISRLLDGAVIEYLMIEFSNSEAICTLSGIPDLQIIIWNWKSASRLSTINLSSTQPLPDAICFSPTNWRRLCVAYKSELNVWNLEQFDDERAKTTHVRFLLPLAAGNQAESQVGAEFKDEYPCDTLAITNMDETYRQSLELVLEKRTRHEFGSVCWLGSDEFIVSTKQNYIFKFSLANSSVKCIFEPDEINVDDRFSLNSDTIINRMLLHRQGLFVICNDGAVRVLEDHQLTGSAKTSNSSVRKLIDTTASLTSNVSFNTKYTHLIISTDKGVELLDCVKLFQNENANDLIRLKEPDANRDVRLDLAVDFDFGRTVDADGVNSADDSDGSFVVLKEFGTVQVWNVQNGQIINRIHLNQKVTCMATHHSMPLVVIGTESGALIFIDFSNHARPRVLENCSLHKGRVKKLKFNTSGTILFSVGDDAKIFLIDVRLSVEVEQVLLGLDQRLKINYAKKDAKFEPGFFVLGYLEYEGELVCMDTFDYQSDDNGQADKTIITRVAIGLHDTTTWETTRKLIGETYTTLNYSNVDKQPQDSTANAANLTHGMVVQNVQTEPVISRLAYTNFNLTEQKSASANVKLASRLLFFEFNFKLLRDKNQLYTTKKLDLKDEYLNRASFHTQYLFSDCMLIARNYLLVFCERFLCKLTIPDVDQTRKTANKLNYLEFNQVVGSHDFGYGLLSKSKNSQFIISSGFDGTVAVRKNSDLKTFVETKGIHFSHGGVHIAKFSKANIKNIVVVGYDGTVLKIDWSPSNEATSKLIKLSGIEGDFNKMALRSIPMNQVDTNPSELTWFEAKEKDFFKEQDKLFLPMKNDILNGLQLIKQKINELLNTNKSREELARLQEHEFYLDLEELERLNKETDLKILKIRESSDIDNTSKLFIREKIKNECWDDMKVKGRGIQAFNSNLLVENYPIKERTREENQLFERIKLIRNIEIKAQKTRHELTADLMRRENIHDLFEIDDDQEQKENDGNQKDQQVVANYLNPNLVQLSYKGSIAPLFNGDSPYLYNQFELYTREQKWLQVAIIQDCIHRIKENFNKEFESVMQRKTLEIGKIKEKNQRLRQIYVDLNEEKQLDEPHLGDVENPEILFDVKDDEIKVEKYLTAEQRKQLEEQLAEEARRRELEKMDNWRERGLMDMMGGVLQIRREDELKKDVPVPAFVKEKAKEDWTADEQLQFVAYENKVKELDEERAKLKKTLSAEINKINEQILECYQNFDNVLLSLHQRKVKTQQAIFQEELKIVRLVNSLIVDLELETYENQVNHKLEKLKEEKKELTNEIQQVKKSFESFKLEIDDLAAQDKAQEKFFLREFADVSPGTRDQLLKLLRKRPKQRFAVNKTNLNMMPTPVAELGADNPFSDRPSTAQQLSLVEAETSGALNELDQFENAPAGVEKSVWERFVDFRRQKIALENVIKLKTLNVNEMALYLQKQTEEDDFKRKEIDDYAKKSLAIQDMRIQAFHNLQVQLLLKQGQVEIDPGAYVHNLENCLLIHRNVVESLNNIIQEHGKQKIAIMVDSKDYGKGIRQLEWEHRKMKMTIDDYIQKQQDITYLKLTREVQEFLNTEDYDGKKQKEVAVLEQTIAYKNKQYEKVYDNKSKKLSDIRNQSIRVANSNDNLDDDLRFKNMSLHDRKHIQDEMAGKTIEIIREEKFQQIIQRRKLVDLAKAQAQEVAFLRSEVERLRMKTFPALVQIEF